MYFRQLLSQALLLPTEAAQLRLALRFGWCWPSDAALAARAVHHGHTPPPAPEVGHVCLISATGSITALWAFGPHPDPDESLVPLRGQAARAWELAQRLAARDLSVLTYPGALEATRRWGARQVAKHGGGHLEVLDGPSYGLAMSLAVASLLLRTAVPADVIASAVVQPDGTLTRVAELQRKLETIRGSALGVRRVMIAAEQEDEARSVLGHAAEVVLVPAASLADAFDHVFRLRELLEAPAELWPTTASAEAAAGQLLRVAVEGSPRLLSWRGFAQTADAVTTRLDPAGAPHEEALTARDIARRHCGEEAVLPWPGAARLAAMGRPVRLKLLAHVVQSVCDAGEELTQRYIDLARPHVAPARERHRGDLELLGAIGRATAAQGDYAAATSMLVDALDEWRRIWREDGSSYALSELLRLAGLQRDPEMISRCVARYVEPFRSHPRTHDSSRAFVGFALGRAWVLAGRPRAATETLGDAGPIDWALTPEHLQLSRGRWWARALQALGHPEQAAAAREQVLAVPSAPAALLTRLDLAIERGEDPTEALAALRAHPTTGAETQRLVAADGAEPSVVEQARRVADHYRY